MSWSVGIKEGNEKEVIVFNINNIPKNSDLILQAIKLAVAIFFSDKTKKICLQINKVGMEVNDIIMEFNQLLPVIKFEQTDDKVNGWFNNNQVIILFLITRIII